MYIQCTKKLLHRLGQPYEKLPNLPEPIQCWHATFFEVGKVAYVVVVNDQIDVQVFLMLKSYQEFTEQFLIELRFDMESQGISAKEIAQFLEESGPITLGPTGERSYINRLNAFTRKLKDFTLNMQDLMDAIQTKDELDELASRFDDVMDCLAENKQESKVRTQAKPKPRKNGSSKSIQTYPPLPLQSKLYTEMVPLDVELLLLGDEKVRRSFLVPLAIDFTTLHTILHIGFGWTDAHMHRFTYNNGKEVIDEQLPEKGRSHISFDDRRTFSNEHGALLSDFVPPAKRFDYEYDCSDGWKHVIKVGKIKLVEGGPYASCTGGQGSTPPEDCGGPIGYATLCTILSDPTHEMYKKSLAWVGDDNLAVPFDQWLINANLKRLKFLTQPL